MNALAPRIYADFHNADPEGRIRLNCVGTTEDLARLQIELREGLTLTLCSDDLDDNGQMDALQVDGVASFSEAEHCWVAKINWDAIRHTSDDIVLQANGDLLSARGTPKEAGAGKSSK